MPGKQSLGSPPFNIVTYKIATPLLCSVRRTQGDVLIFVTIVKILFQIFER